MIALWQVTTLSGTHVSNRSRPWRGGSRLEPCSHSQWVSALTIANDLSRIPKLTLHVERWSLSCEQLPVSDNLSLPPSSSSASLIIGKPMCHSATMNEGLQRVQSSPPYPPARSQYINHREQTANPDSTRCLRETTNSLRRKLQNEVQKRRMGSRWGQSSQRESEKVKQGR